MYDPKRNPYLGAEFAFAFDEAGPQFDFSRLAGSFGSGVRSGYEATKEFSDAEVRAFESMKSAVMPHVQRAVEFCKGISKTLEKLRIPTPLAVLAVAAVLSGAVAGAAGAGVAAGALAGASQIPMLAVVYFVQKTVAGGAEWLLGMGHGDKHECLSFAGYCAARDLQEGYEGLYDLASSVGNVAGRIGGTVSKYASAAAGAARPVASSVAKAFRGVVAAFKRNPKAAGVSALKVAIVVAAAMIAGGVAASAYKLLTTPDGWQQVGQAVAGLGAGSAEDVVKELSGAAHDAAGHSVAGHAQDAASHAHDAAAHGHSASDQVAHAAGHYGRDLAAHGVKNIVRDERGERFGHTAHALNLGIG